MSSEASFIYPPRGNFSAVAPSGNVNIYDTLEITYNSTWSALNLTLFCLSGSTATDYQVWNVKGNPILASGTYQLESIDSVGFDIYQFPTNCSFKLTKYGDNDIAVGGKDFRLVSEEGTSTTYRMTSTSSDSAYTTQTATGDLGPVTKSTSTSATAGSISSSDPNSTSSPTVTSTSTPEPVTEATGLSTGAKAGIGIGVAVVILVIAVLCFMVLRLRKRVQKPLLEEKQIHSPEASPHVPPQDQKAEHVYNINELDQTSRVELSAQPKRTRPSELE